MWIISLIFCIILFALWIIWRKRKFNFFKQLDIPGPPPSLLFGNFWELLYEGQHNCINKWIKQYGRVFGYYYGLRPILIIADLDILKRIQLKEFRKFPNRAQIFSVKNPSQRIESHALTAVLGKRWKELRSITTPTFTVAKLKKMSPITIKAVDELLQAVEKESTNGKSFDIFPLYQNLTMDVIARTSLGIHTHSQTDKNEPFVKLARLIFSFKMNIFMMLFVSFAEFWPIFISIRKLMLCSQNKGKFPKEELLERIASAVKVRRNNPEYRRTDVLQLMMDAQHIDGSVQDSSLTAGENEETISNENAKQEPRKNGKGLTDEEIVHNCCLFLLAGFETTSNALALLTHILVYNQDVQDKVREEIITNISKDEELSYDAVNKLRYLDNVLNESLRLYPPVTYFVNREAAEDTIIDNIRIPNTLSIQVPVYYLHHDPTLWEKPEKFYPERFSPEEKSKIHPMAFQAFGAGPRNCIGMRFAQMEIKMAIAKLLRNYRLLPEKGKSKVDFKILNTVATMRPEEGVVIQVECLSVH